MRMKSLKQQQEALKLTLTEKEINFPSEKVSDVSPLCWGSFVNYLDVLNSRVKTNNAFFCFSVFLFFLIQQCKRAKTLKNHWIEIQYKKKRQGIFY